MDAQTVIFHHLGTANYRETWNLQEQLFSDIVKAKQNSISPLPPNHLIFCEHPHVLTLGKSGSGSNLLVNQAELERRGIQFYHIDRGGDITYHGPGQIVGYPIFDLEAFGMGVKQYIHALEQSIILTLADYSISAGRLEGATGVWLDAEIPGKARKICAIGVRTSRYVTMHGFAFNVNTDLTYYRYINPCGFIDKGVTSMEKELGERQDFNAIKSLLLTKMEEVFGFSLA
jgi:lipoyl(octanoyl) transferase